MVDILKSKRILVQTLQLSNLENKEKDFNLTKIVYKLYILLQDLPRP